MIVKQGEMTFNTKDYSDIPDLWHIAQNHTDPTAREAILQVWHAAHAYRRALNTIARPDIHAEVDVSGM